MAEPAGPLVGIVVVSHSAKLAEGVVELAAQNCEGVRLVSAGGMADGAVGTDAMRIAEAIEVADSGAGVVVVADLGSAIMSTETAFALADPDGTRTRLVEEFSVAGVVGAAVQAKIGSPLDDVAAAASRSGLAVEAPGSVSAPVSFEAVVTNPVGFHGRAASNLVQTAARFKASISIEDLTAGGAPFNAKGFNDVLHSGVERDHRVRVTVAGVDRDEAVVALRALADRGFPDLALGGAGAAVRPATRPVPADAGQRWAGSLAGQPGAPGVATGPVWRYQVAAPRPATPVAGDSERVLREASQRAAADLGALVERLRERRPDDAAILLTQALLAAEPSLLGRAIERAQAGQEPASAIEAVYEAEAVEQSRLTDETLAARAADYRDVGARIARIIRGEALDLPSVPSIAVAEDLPPSVAEEIPEDLLMGVAIEGGSATSHVVILSRGRGIPAVVAVPGLLAAAGAADAAGAATTIAVDGATGEVVLDPDAAARAEFDRRAAELVERRASAASLRGRLLFTADDRRVGLLANIGGPEDAARALEMGADGVGLFRTEFLFMKRPTAPTEDEQVEPYRRVFEAFGPNRPVVVRLADIGGDKALPYLNLPAEENPFLGVRAIRLAERSPELLAAQLRAIWRAAGLAGVVPHVMAPMVATLEDARLLIALRDEARATVAASGAGVGESLPGRMVTGVMVEVPSAALIARELAETVDFFSIGTNDLTQYTLAADRSNPALARLQDALHPAVLRLVERVVAGGHEAGITVAVCGELAGDPLGALVLVGLGVDELSADAGSLDGIRAVVSRVTSGQLAELARRALAAPDAAAVRAMAREVAG